MGEITMGNGMRSQPGICHRVRKYVAVGLCYFWPVSLITAQQPAAVAPQSSIAPVRPKAPVFWRPYEAAEVPPARMSNSAHLHELIKGGTLYLTAQDAITLALENNIDVEIARYNPISLAWSLERSEAGGALPGVPSGASQVTSSAGGQGVQGSQAAAGVSGGSSAARGGGGNATISQIGPTAQTYDPAIQESTTFSHQTYLQADAVQTGENPVLLKNQRIYTGSYAQGFSSGGSVTVSYNDHYLDENASTDVVNPSVFPTLSISLQQNLLQGFGEAVNTRSIVVGKINLRNSDLNFKSQLINTVVSVLNAYYALSGDYEDMKAKQSAHDVAARLYEDSKKQVEIGSLAQIDLVTTEGQVASTESDLAVAQATLAEQEIQLKNLICRTWDPLLASAHVVPLDKMEIPAADDIAPLPELVRTAMTNRSDLAAEKVSLTTSEVNAVGTKNGVLPVLVGFAGTSNAGAAGAPRTVGIQGQTFTADKYFVGGIGTALGQVFRRDFPTESAGGFFQATLRNGQAQADNAIDQLSIRQSQLSNAKDINQAQVDILNAVVAVRQARARYDAAVRGHTLNQQLLEAEQKKFSLGTSTPSLVIQQQRDLTTAQSTETAALVSYADARVGLDQTLGTVLDTHHVSIATAK
jgi:outer membrane protein